MFGFKLLQYSVLVCSIGMLVACQGDDASSGPPVQEDPPKTEEGSSPDDSTLPPVDAPVDDGGVSGEPGTGSNEPAPGDGTGSGGDGTGSVDDGTVPEDDTPPDEDATPGITVTEILGQSQTEQWWPKSHLSGWQARIEVGSGYMNWLEPDFKIWDTDKEITPGIDGVIYPSSDVERVVITIGKQTPQPLDTYASVLEETMVTVRAKYPALKQIVLQPLAGGPDRALCYIESEVVLTTQNLAAIEEAMAILTEKYADVKTGVVPLVDDCSEFEDFTGHLLPDGGDDVADQVDAFYNAE